MNILKTKGNDKVIDLTKLRGHINFEINEYKGKHGGEYFVVTAKFEDGTILKIDMQLAELINLKLHKEIGKTMNKESKPDLIEDIMELVTGEVVRDRILKSIFD